MDKKQLIDTLLHSPLSFNDQMLDDLISLGLTFSEVRECVRKIYDLTETQLTSISNANEGILGKLNKYSTARRSKRFNRRIDTLKEGDDYKIIYAEGDSWFQFPVFIKDIIDWLSKNKRYIIYSNAYGGDWLTNIIYESQYIPSLSVFRPEFFLISGGGNDLVGNNRLSIMIREDYNQPKYHNQSSINDPSLIPAQKDMIMRAQNHITKEFYAILWAIKAQYLLLFRQIYSPESTQKGLITITQGYDYAIPGIRPEYPLLSPVRSLINKMADNGCWLKRPLKISGIFDHELQKAVILTLIYEFNQIFISVAQNPEFENIYHIDCRGLADETSWYDELHYKSYVFKKVAAAYEYIIENHGQCSKVIRVTDYK